MSYEFRLQDPGEGIHEAEIVEIKVTEGSRVEEGEDVLVAETDKAAVDIPSPVTGEVTEVVVSEGDIVEVGDVLMVLEEEKSGAAGSDEEEQPAQDEGEEAAPAEKADETAQDDEEGAAAEKNDTSKSDETRSARGSDEAETDEATEEDESEPETEEADSGKDRGRKRDQAEDEAAGGGDDLATPAVRGLARELGVDLTGISGTGENGRVLESDVRKAADGAESPDKEQTGKGEPADREQTGKGEPADEGEEGVERVKLRSIRRSTAKRMAQAWREIPHVTHHDAIDITEIERMRREHAAEVDKTDAKLTLTPFIMKALAGALKEHPRFNARFDADNEEVEIVRAVNMGIALDTGRGLLVPVVRDIRRKTLLELAAELGEISDRLKSERATADMLKGATFTLTNVGSIGGTGFSPIISPPQVAIFGAARAELRQVLVGDIDHATPRTRLVLPVCVAFDHRVNDGADAARFMNSVKLLLSDPEQFTLRS